MKEICKYRLENGHVPQYIVDGGYWMNPEQFILGVANGAPVGAVLLTIWEVQDHIMDIHNVTPLLQEDEVTPLTESEVLQVGWDLYVDKVGQPSIDDARKQRDKLLADTDWTDLPSAPLTSQEKTDWQTYRQALRDLPQNHADAASVVWPAKPE